MKAHFEMMAAYNAWANQRLYDAAFALSEEEYRRDCQLFFGSLHGTLNHLFVADVIWLARFRDQPNPPWRLDHIAHDRREDLQKRRVSLDRDIIGFTGALDEGRLASEFTYRTMVNNKLVTQELSAALAHFFNHQTHHRGQCHAALTRLVGAAPAMDLAFFQREG
ncbi:MAG: DinB family protein [Pseudomonadota bacterium]